MPNFLIIGAARSGTTALYAYLGQHPQIYVSPLKEPHFFASEGEMLDFRAPGDDEMINRVAVTDLAAYRSLFRGAGAELAVGEASTSYLYSPKAPLRIRHHIQDVKLIAILRNPIARAYSAFLYMIRRGKEPLRNFEAALEQEETRIADNWQHIWHYRQMGFYHAQLRRYFDTFNSEQIAVFLYEDFCENPLGMCQDIFRFLGLDDTFAPRLFSKTNVSGIPRNRFLQSLLNRLTAPGLFSRAMRMVAPPRVRSRIRDANLVNPRIPQAAQEELAGTYRGDILALQDLVERDLSAWLKVPR